MSVLPFIIEKPLLLPQDQDFLSPNSIHWYTAIDHSLWKLGGNTDLDIKLGYFNNI